MQTVTSASCTRLLPLHIFNPVHLHQHQSIWPKHHSTRAYDPESTRVPNPSIIVQKSKNDPQHKMALGNLLRAWNVSQSQLKSRFHRWCDNFFYSRSFDIFISLFSTPFLFTIILTLITNDNNFPYSSVVSHISVPLLFFSSFLISSYQYFLFCSFAPLLSYLISISSFLLLLLPYLILSYQYFLFCSFAPLLSYLSLSYQYAMQNEIHSGPKKFLDCYELRLQPPCITMNWSLSPKMFSNPILELKLETCKFSKYISSNLGKQLEMFSFHQKLRRMRFQGKLCSTKYFRKYFKNPKTRKSNLTAEFV